MSTGSLFEVQAPASSVAKTEPYAWWNSLRHHRLLLSGTALHQCFADHDPAPLPARQVEELAYACRKFQLEPTAEALAKWLEVAVHSAIGSDAAQWAKGNAVGSDWTVKVATGENIKPRWVWKAGSDDALPLFVTEGGKSIGVGRGRRDHARILDWLRAQRRDLAVITNGKQWRLVFATETTDAWCESDVEQWFSERQEGPNLEGLRLLLSESGIRALREGISETRKGHAELSKVLGERVRQAVEVLVDGSQASIDEVLAASEGQVQLEHVYQAATRVAMRLVVVMFAESRQLLSSPSLSATRDAYWESYSLQRIRLILEQESLAGSRANTAWPRILALFNLLYRGSSHKDLTRRAYGGRLFQPGDSESSDPILRALSAFERADRCPTDRNVLEVLKLMAYAPVRLRQGRATTLSVLPVDFSQLDVEYVGILYEGLLDYELHRVGVNEPVVFLNVGIQPVLPLSRLEEMSDASLKEMVKELSKKEKAGTGEDEAEDAEETDDEVEAEGAEVGDEQEATEDVESDLEPVAAVDADSYHAAKQRAEDWAKRAVVAAGIVKNPRGRNINREMVEQAIERAGRGLISRIAVPGELYLVRHGGTRKGSGTFYTKPQLAEPTVARTLEPLLYRGEVPEDPETVLGVKVCDPACGSGSFLVSSLRYLSRALFESITTHDWITEHPDGRISWEDPQNARPAWFKEALKDFRGLNERPDALFGQTPREKVEAQLLRVVAERCIYGVDLNPLAVELAKLSLWIATMDPNLRFSFLDHKIKAGNGLVGCWFDRFQDYPVLAWMREGGDKTHSTSVHHKPETWTKAISGKRDQVKKEMQEVLSGQGGLFAQPELPSSAHAEAVAAYERLHAVAQDPEAQATAYRQWRASPGFTSLKSAFDAWCALWFWPPDQLDMAPMPKSFGRLSDETHVAVQMIYEENLFFHWELEFPDVFDGTNPGFAAVVGNPPWDNPQINPLQWFSDYDPMFRTYGRIQGQEAIRELFKTNADIERAWISANLGSKSLANWIKNVGESASRSDKPFPFRLQMGRVFTYRLFLEQCLFVLRPGGRLGQIVPSAIYSDAWSAPLRKHLLLENQWEWLFGFENRNKVFDIDSRFKFCPLVVQKGGETVEVQTAFMRRELDDWSRPERFAIPVTREQIVRFSPKSMAFLEIQDERDVRVLEKMTTNGVPLGDDGPDGWGVKYALEFMMNSDAKLFPPREKWEAKGYRPDEYGHWLLGDWVSVDDASSGAFDTSGWVKSREGDAAIEIEAIRDVALPLYEGRMIGQFDFSQKGWVSGKGRTAVWREIPWEAKQIEPQYLMALSDGSCGIDPRVLIMDIGSATNARTGFAAVVANGPAGHSAPTLSALHGKFEELIAFCAVFDSYVFDFQLRKRIGGLHLTWNFLEDIPLPRAVNEAVANLQAARFLSGTHRSFSVFGSVESAQAYTPYERQRMRCIVDAVAAHEYRFEAADFRWILRDCDHPVGQSTSKAFTRNLDGKGFWRVEKAQPPELRHTVLAQVAFDDLLALIAQHGEEEGMQRFLGTGPDDGWMLPETLCLADYGLGHDERAKVAQPVASVLAPRFYEWQLQQTPDEAWGECQRHAENLRRIRAVGIVETPDEAIATDLFGGQA